ncbi:MAG TPA: hypothetical protein VFD00_04570, partial [Thermoclostridium sp.]|nr:hypothetical protein [Thermoclostridium sp.]
MDVYEKALARCIFQNKIYRSDGQSFQDLFVSIMNYAEESFQLIKPWGNIGDRKNDGYMQVSSLEEYLASNGDFLADTLRDKVNKVYFEERVLHEG